MVRLALISVVVAASVMEASAHSWLDCLDWRDGKCFGYARNFAKQPAVPFGADVGRDMRPGADVPAGLVCGPRERPNANVEDGYSATYPMSQVKPGSTITMRWPAKNHATVGTQRGVQLFISKGPGLGDDFSNVVSKADWIAKNPGLEQTFSNCSPNQAGVDRAICTGDFKLPADLAPGVYTFMWWWEFNGGEFYNSCADVLVTNTPNNGGGGGGGGTPTPPTPTPPTPTPPAPTPPTPPVENCGNNVYAQCGGQSHTGETCCPGGTVCREFHQYYSQCIPDATVASLDSAAVPEGAGSSNTALIAGAAAAGGVALIGAALFTMRRRRDAADNTAFNAQQVATPTQGNPMYAGNHV